MVSVLCAVLFLVCMVILTVLRPEMDPSRRYVSEFATGRFGWLMTASFFVVGGGVTVLAEGLHRVLPRSRVAELATGTLAIGGCGLAVLGAFPADHQGAGHTTPGLIHATVAIFTFLYLNAAFVLLAREFRLHASWQPLHPWAIGIAAASIVALLWFFSAVMLTHPWHSQIPRHMQGAGQRMAILWSLLWLGAVSARLAWFSEQSVPVPTATAAGPIPAPY